MSSIFVEIGFNELHPEQKDLLIAQLTEAGYDGFEEKDDELLAYIPEKNFDRALLLELSYKHQLHYSEKKIQEKNWNAEWESGFEPVIVGDFVAVRADFHAPVKKVTHEIIITPKMSFGTGHHATTFMMIRTMQELVLTGKNVLDFGTGTGILAILAEKMGAERIIAIDNDDWSISNAKENLEKNRCQKINLVQSDNPVQKQKFDFILANINKNIILEYFSSLADQLAAGGEIIMSGLLNSDEEDILSKAGDFSLRVSMKLEEKNWICLRFIH